jgi:hypothetical protein
LWTYVPDNSHQWGDLWYVGWSFISQLFADRRRNNEDLSIWSQDDARKTEVFIDPSKANSYDQSLAQSTSSLSSVSSYTPKTVQSGEGITPALILEGSRAVGAVVRPYPVATVGQPVRIDFDINSTTFKLQVKVTSQDAVPEEVETEVYLPFVHYASSLGPYASDVTLSSRSSSRNSSKTSLVKDSVPPTPVCLSAETEGPLKLLVDVTASHGTYTIIGQTLFWKYPVPTSGEEIYTLEVKRTGGPLVRELGYTQTGGWGDVCSNCTIA